MVKAVMTMHDNFTDRSQLIDYLAVQLLRGRLALVLGAGVSKPFGLPDWGELLKDLFAGQGGVVPVGETPERIAELFRIKYFGGNPVGFAKAVRSALYANVRNDFTSLRANDTLSAISSLVMASHRGSASEVITFNFDDLLETFLGYFGFVTSSIFEEAHWAQSADVTVYHPHGLIPFNQSQKGSDGSKLVFDQASYSAVVGRDGGLWRQTILMILRRRTCLFIGLSGRDNNLDSMMQECKQQHAIHSENTAYWGVNFSTSDDEVARSIWQERGVFYNKISDYKSDLPSFLFAICQTAAALRGNR